MPENTPTMQGLSMESFKNMQLNAGAFFAGVDTTAWTPATLANEVGTALVTAKKEGKCLGATTGGGKFRAVPEVRNIEADGMRAAIKGSTVFDAWDVGLSTTLKEITKDNLAYTLATSSVNEETGAIQIRNTLQLDDYIDSMLWAGNIQDNKLIVIEILNAINTVGTELTFADKGEGTIAVDYKAHQDDLDKMEYAPCNIWIFDNASGEQVPAPEGFSAAHSIVTQEDSGQGAEADPELQGMLDFAAANSIDLGNATSKNGVLRKIQDAGYSYPPSVEGETENGGNQ